MEIPKTNQLAQRIFSINNVKEFNNIVLEVYHFQFQFNPVYQSYCQAINKTPQTVIEVNDIPFLPISFFKTHQVRTTAFEPELTFKSSGTTGITTSTHGVKDAKIYQSSFELAFTMFYGSLKGVCVLGLLPSYLERGQSSLVYMVEHLIRHSDHPNSGFYLHDLIALNQTIQQMESTATPTILIGVTYALLNFATMYPQPLRHTLLMETGGMKGRGPEMIKDEMYDLLKVAFDVKEIHAEYGMTELLSQAYAINGKYKTPPWMKLLIRDETDPFMMFPEEQYGSGGINIIDLANVYSCAFIATDDIGKRDRNGFEILGRMDHSDIRGCSLLTVK